MLNDPLVPGGLPRQDPRSVFARFRRLGLRERLCDLDSYRPGPNILDRDRQHGSTRFMAPEEFCRGAQIDERTTVFTLGRAAYVLLSDGPRG